MIYLLYNLLSTLFLIFSSPYFLPRALIDERFRREMIERMGFLSDSSVKKPIWVHAASVGEVFCCIPLLRRIKKEYPECEVVLTTMTRTGNKAAKASVTETDRVLFFPIDHPLTIQKSIRSIRPCLLLLTETELWPNLLRQCGKRAIPIVLFNGRISEKSFRHYLFFRSFFKGCLRYISLFLMQTEEDRERVVKIGVPIDKTKVLGNMKFDQPFPSLTQESLKELAQSLRLRGEETLLIAGSTHSGEEEILLSLFRNLREIDPHLVLILAPRHLERLGEVEQILKKESLLWVRKTSVSMDESGFGQEKKGPPEVILLDTMGELMSLYGLGTLVFIGGTLVPVGGHNPLEPLFFKKCVLFGPHMFHFSEISRHLIEVGGAIQVGGKEDLVFHLKHLLSDEGARKEIGEKGYQFLQKHRGATEKVFEAIRPLLSRIQNTKL